MVEAADQSLRAESLRGSRLPSGAEVMGGDPWHRPAGDRDNENHGTEIRMQPSREETMTNHVHCTTLLDLVQTIQQPSSSQQEVVGTIRELINSGTVILTGSFAGHCMDETAYGRQPTGEDALGEH
jgi:hypothetical protein